MRPLNEENLTSLLLVMDIVLALCTPSSFRVSFIRVNFHYC